MPDFIDLDDLMDEFDKNNPEVRKQLRQYYRDVGVRVQSAMKRARIDIDELALFCGVQPVHIDNLCNGVPGYVHGKLVGLVAQALGTQPDSLWGTPPI